MLGQQGHWIRLISSQTSSQPCLRPAAASSGLRRLLPLCKSSSSSATGGAKRKRTRQPRGRSKGAYDQAQLNAAPEPLPAPDIASNAATAPAPPLDAAYSAAADAQTAAAAQSLSELVPVPSGPRLEFPDAPFKLRPYQVDAIRSIIRSWKGGNNAQMVMLPTGCGKTVVFSALSRYMSEHYVAPAPASDTAAPVTDANSSSTPSAPSADGGSAQGRGSPTVAAAATGNGGVSEAAQATASEADGGGSSSRDDSSDTHAGSTRSAASDGDEDMLVGAVSRFQQLRQAATDSSGSTGASSTPPSQQCPQLGSSESSSESSSTQSRSRAGRQAAAGKSSRHSRSSSPSTPTLSNSSSSLASSSRADESGSGNLRRQSPKQQQHQQHQQQQHPPPQQQQQQQQKEVGAPAGSMRVLVLAHRHELLHQAEEKFRLMWGSQDLSVSWVKGKRKEFDGQVVVASVATAVNCIPALRDCGFSLVIIDEAHHAVANTYKTVLEGLGLTEEVVAPADTQSADTDTSPGSSVSPSLSSVDEATDESFGTSDSISFAAGRRISGSSADPEEAAGSQPPRVITRVIPNPHQLLLGFTATPYRRMKRESEDLYAILRPTYTASISTMIRNNYLAQVSSQKIMTETDLQGIAVSKGDFVLGQLSPLVNSRSRNKLVLASYLEQCTEPDPCGEAARTPEQQRQHEIISRERARLVTVALQKSDRRKEAKAEEKRRAAAAAAAADASAADTSDSSDEEQEGGEKEEEDDKKEEGEMFPLPPGVTPAQLTGGLTMAGRRAVRRTIAFAVDIKHAEAMNIVFNAAGVHASAIHSMMPLDTMKQELARFRAGQLDVLFNVEVLTEGFDEPAIDAILMARPTRSTGLYTQMLGRGLRIMPGKKDCLVLDFTDKYHQAGAVVDVRVLLVDIFAPKMDGPQQPDRGPARIDEGAEGGQVDLVERGIDPKDLAWRTIGPHCMTSIFSAGNVWLVNVAGMGPTQRVSLGLVAPNSRPVLGCQLWRLSHSLLTVTHRVAMLVGSTPWPVPKWLRAAPRGQCALQMHPTTLALCCVLCWWCVCLARYVILHQEQGDRDPDPCNWRVAYTPQNHTWRGFSKEDAYGTALTYIETLMRTEQAKYVARFVRAKRTGQGTPKGGYPHLSSFKQDAPWRGQAASEKQLAVLTRLGIAVAGPITKGQASDLISADKCSLAEPAQRARLQDCLGNDLPVPLLKAHAEALLATAATAHSSSSSSSSSS